jgi:hypothetical protein
MSEPFSLFGWQLWLTDQSIILTKNRVVKWEYSKLNSRNLLPLIKTHKL